MDVKSEGKCYKKFGFALYLYIHRLMYICTYLYVNNLKIIPSLLGTTELANTLSTFI